MVLGQFFQTITDYASGSSRPTETLVQTANWCIIISALGAGAFTSNALLMSTWIVFGEAQARTARQRTFDNLVHQELAWYDGQADGTPSLLIRIETQINELRTATSQVFGFLVVDIITAIGCFAVAFAHSWKLALLMIAFVPLAQPVLSLTNRRLEPAISRQKAYLAEGSKRTNAFIAAIDLVKIHNGFSQEVRQYSSTVEAAKEQYLMQARYSAVQISYMQFWASMLFVVGFWVGAWLVTQGANAAQVLTTFYATLTALQGLSSAMPQWLVLIKGMSAGHDLDQLIASPGTREAPKRKTGTLRPEKCARDVRVVNATFSYPQNPKKAVLENSSFHFPAGQTTFVIGRSGSGKSTLGSLLVNFYEPQVGVILVDDLPVNNLDEQWLRENVTLVQQSSTLFQGTIFENIALGSTSPENVSLIQVKTACDLAMLQSTIIEIPNGMETVVDSSGSTLSGGQKQRLALARARLRDPPVLILDEVTSGLDQENKEMVMEAVRKWRQGKTTIVITHDLSQIEDEDYVYVLEKGRVAQEGKHKVLSKDNKYLFGRLDTPKTSEPEEQGSKRRGPRSIRDLHSYQQSQSARHGRRRSRAWRMSIGGSTAIKSGWGLSTAYRGLSAGRDRFTPQLTTISDSDEERSPVLRNTMLQASDRSTMDALQVSGMAVQRSRRLSNRILRRWHGQDALSDDGRQRPNNPDEVADQGAEEEVTKVRRAHSMSLRAIFLTVWPHLATGDKIRLVIGLVCCIIAAGCNPAFSFCFARLLATFWAPGGWLGATRDWVVYLFIIAVVNGGALFVERCFMESTGQAWADAVRLEGMKRVLRQPKAWFDEPENSPCRISECFDCDAEEMRNLVARFGPLTLMLVVMVSISTTWAMTISWKLTLVSISTTPIILCTVKLLSVAGTKWESACNEGACRSTSLMNDALVNIRVTKAFTLETLFSQRYMECAESTRQLGVQRALTLGPFYGLNQSLNYLIIALVFWYGMYLTVYRTEMSATQLQEVVNLLLFCVGQASAMVSFIPQISASQAAATRMLHLASRPVEGPPHGGSTDVPSSLFPIKMLNISFAYPSRPKQPVLRDLSLQVDQGICMAIVGPSGSGKSTIISLLMGLYNSSQRNSWNNLAQVSFASIDIRRLDKAQLSHMISYVPQTPSLFPTTIAENIAYGLGEKSALRQQSNIERAARAADIHSFIVSLPQGYQTLVGDGGQALSGGQAQRVCIARALARKPLLLVMDEPTGSLGHEAAENIRQTMKSVLKKQTRYETSVVIATHDKETMRIADHIVVIEDGKVVDEGGFEELKLRGRKLRGLIEDSP
ncbi:ABC a-pheromone efflux pump [Colletotrichum plurivorum]|uniref:ABC a-pheromone efflux pump n=1 Tax=Colletotrichum plurivorum TaxID=2175906 RepID=A0A8H6N828_9PEZI|nr:ABC a-pheromone efflux pump [Colletotrichum plurivorum]